MMYQNVIFRKSFVFLLAFCTIFISSCTITDHLAPDGYPTVVFINDSTGDYPLVKNEVNYQPTKIPTNPQDLVFYYDLKTPVQLANLKDTVVIYIEGGPQYFRDTLDVHIVKAQFVDELSNGNYSTIGLNQAHFTNPTVFGSGSRFTAQNAREVNNATLTMLENAINWLKSGKKVVIVLGFSNGSLITQAYLTTGKTLADYHIIGGTRLVAPPEIVNAYTNNLDFSYTDGTQFTTKAVTPQSLPYFNVLTKLQLDGLRNYTSLLAGKPFLGHTFYMLGAHDEALGTISAAEQTFLTQSKIPNYTVNDAGGVHAAAILGLIEAIAYFRTLK